MAKGTWGGRRAGAGSEPKGRDCAKVRIGADSHKLAGELVAKARMVAARRGVSMSVLLTELLETPIERAYKAEVVDAIARENAPPSA